MIMKGDIVVRKDDASSSSYLIKFYSGFMIVIESRLGFGKVCKIMNHFGMTSWIDQRSLRIIIRNKNEQK